MSDMTDLKAYALAVQTDETADNMLVAITSRAMQEKLEKKRYDGRSGWHTDACSIAFLEELLEEHIAKGDMVDVINIAAMIMVRNMFNSDSLLENEA